MSLYHYVVWQPLYNGLIFLMDVIPWADAGIVVILFTIIIKLILFPLSKKATITQVQMKRIEPEINKIKEKVKDRQAQALQTMALYKEKGINPFSGILLLILQLPILWALYSIFARGGLPHVKIEELYAFVKVPTISMDFLGLISIGDKSITLAVVAGVVQFIQTRLIMPTQKKKEGENPSFQQDLARSMSFQMQFILPLLIGWAAYSFGAAIGLYLIVSSIFAIGQEIVVKRRIEAKEMIKVA